MKIIIASLSLVLSLSATNAWAQGDMNNGKSKAIVCAGCHGMNGFSASSVIPNLAGQKPAYLVKQLQDFKSNKRRDPIMSGPAMSLSQEDMEDLASYFSNLK